VCEQNACFLLGGVVVQEGREQATEESKRGRQRDQRGSLPEPSRLGYLSKVVQEHQAQGATEHVAEEVEPEVQLPQQAEAADLLPWFLRDAAVSVSLLALGAGTAHVDDDASARVVVGAEIVDPVLPLGGPYLVEALSHPERQRDEYGGGQQHAEADHVLPRRQPPAAGRGPDAAYHGAGSRGERDGEHYEECRVRLRAGLAPELDHPERRRHRDGDEHRHDGVEEEVGLGLGAAGHQAGYRVRQAGVHLGAEAQVAGGEAHRDAAAGAEVAHAEEVADGVDPADAVPGQGGEQEQVPVPEAGAVQEQVLDPVADEAERGADEGHEPQRQVQRRHPGEPPEELARVRRERQEVELHLRDVLQLLELRRVHGEVRVRPVDGLQPDAPDEAQPVGGGRGRHRVLLRWCCHFRAVRARYLCSTGG
jgi:hypothetical protein